MAWIEPHWQRVSTVSVALYPLSLGFALAVAARRLAYRTGFARSERLPVPVIVVGNLTVGGSGKTPLTLWLAATLRARGRNPGIVCRGYGASSRGPQRVLPDSDPERCGDEAVLLARRSRCPVWSGADRVAAARALLAARPGCDVLLSDDGLQHYALARDVEICVVDAARGFGNGWLLPAGPLREPLERLGSVDALVLNEDLAPAAPALARRLPQGPARFAMRLEGGVFYSVLDPARRAAAAELRGKRVHALAGIGHPERFFHRLERLGLEFSRRAFPDHHRFTPGDIVREDADAIVMTEKDAVKCERFATERHWALAVDAVPEPGLAEWIVRGIEAGTRG